MTVKLNIGYVATAITPYYSDEYKVREKSEASLKKLLADFDVNFIPFHKTIFSTEDSKEAETKKATKTIAKKATPKSGPSKSVKTVSAKKSAPTKVGSQRGK